MGGEGKTKNNAKSSNAFVSFGYVETEKCMRRNKNKTNDITSVERTCRIVLLLLLLLLLRSMTVVVRFDTILNEINKKSFFVRSIEQRHERKETRKKIE